MRTICVCFVVLSSVLLTSCGTTKGVLSGVGSILEGAASDVKSVGGMF